VQRFARDVGINVLANLVAAAIIYLLGVWQGVFRDQSLVAAAAAFLILAGAPISGYLFSYALQAESRSARWFYLVMDVFLLLMAVGSVQVAATTSLLPWWVAAASVVYAVSVICTDVWVWLRRRTRSRPHPVATTRVEWAPDPRAYL
jgi:hypothetical protein